MSRIRHAIDSLDEEIEDLQRDILEKTSELAELLKERDAQRGPARPSDNLTPEEIALIEQED